MTDTDTAAPAEAEKQKRTPTEVKVQFVDTIPERTAGSQPNRKSKYDAVYGMLSENPGRWAYIGDGKNLHGSLLAYKKRRDLEDMKIAWRNGAVYAGVGVTIEGDEQKGSEAAESPAPEAAQNPAEGTPASPVFPASTGSGADAKADDSW